jgi:hypothetical protein
MAGKVILALYLLPGDRPDMDNFDRARASLLEKVGSFVYILSHRDDLAKVKTPEVEWWGFLFGNEWFDEDLSKALHVHLRYNKADCLTLFKDVITSEGERKAFMATRLFRTCAVPVLGVESYKNYQNELTFEKVLDGWLMEDTRV